MIWFLDTEAFAVQKEDIDSNHLRQFFFSGGHMDDILLVYDGDSYLGVVTYSSYLQGRGVPEEEMGYLFREKYIHEPGDEAIWTELDKIFERVGNWNRDVLIPVFDIQGNMLYFACNDKRLESREIQEQVELALYDMERLNLREFFSEAYPQIRAVRIYHLNEWGYSFYKIMKKNGYPVEVFGEKWEVLFPETRSQTDRIMVPETAFMNVFAEGTDFIDIRNNFSRRIYKDMSLYWYHLLQSISTDYYTWEENQLLARCSGIRFLKIQAPLKEELKFKSIEEFYCAHWPLDILKHGSQEEKDHCFEVLGRKMTWQEWQDFGENKSQDVIRVGGTEMTVKRFGNQRGRKMYIIGPCIVEGATVPCDEESLLYCLHEEMVSRGIDCSVVGIVVPMLRGMALYKKILESLTIAEDDMVLSLYYKSPQPSSMRTKGEVLDLTELYHQRSGYWFYDAPLHTNYLGNRAIATAVAERIRTIYKKKEHKFGGALFTDWKKGA